MYLHNIKQVQDFVSLFYHINSTGEAATLGIYEDDMENIENHAHGVFVPDRVFLLFLVIY